MSLEKYITTPLDHALLENKEQYAFYFKIVDLAFNELISTSKKNNICTEQESIFFKQYSELLIYSIEALRVKYLYNEEDKMRIDLTDSGFPNYMELRYLTNDLSLKNDYLEKLPSVDALKKEFKEELFSFKEPISKLKLHQAASIIYYTSINQRYIFKRFVQGKIIETTNYDAAYVVSWSFYDITYNRPFICFLYFNYDGRNIEDYKSKLYDVLKNAADRSIELDSIAYLIDKKLTKIYPTRIKKIDVGPLHNIFAKDENVYTHALLTGISTKELPMSSYCVSLKIDEAYTKGSFKEGSFLNKQKLQIWEIEKPKKYLFSPHKTTQYLYTAIPEVLNVLTVPPMDIKAVE